MSLLARRARAVVVALCCALVVPAPAHAKPALDLDRVLAKAMRATHVPAMGVLVLRDGAVADQAVRGVRRTDSPDLVQAGDAWMIGSTSKVQTVALIARLVEQGTLSWDAPLSAMLPDASGARRPEYAQVTLVQLLGHRAGLPENVSDMAFIEGFMKDARPLPEQRLDYVTRALSEAPTSAPGTDWSYSNTGFLIAAAIAERATGRTYEALMRDEVFGPLGMTTAGFGAPPAGQPSGHAAGAPVGVSNADMFAPAGNLHMSLGDWARFNADQLAGERGHGTLLTPDDYARMQTPTAPGASGLDWGIQPSIAGRIGPAWVHGGSDGFWFAYVVLFPNSGNGALVVDNADEAMGGDKAAMAALKAVLPWLAPTGEK
jgi:CubicO group peptidase (beta-lactamase class C family)